MKRFLVSAVVALSLLVVPVNAMAAGLVTDANGIRYVDADGSFAKNCHRAVNGTAFHFDANGYADKTGFDACQGKWKNTKKGKRYFFTDGRIPVGTWLLPDGHYYEFDSNGYMLKDMGSPLDNTLNLTPTTTTNASNSTTNNSGNTKKTETKPAETPKNTDSNTTPSTPATGDTPNADNGSGSGSGNGNGNGNSDSGNSGGGKTETPQPEKSKYHDNIDFSKYVKNSNGLIEFRASDVVYDTPTGQKFHLSQACAGNDYVPIKYGDNKKPPCEVCTVMYIQR